MIASNKLIFVSEIFLRLILFAFLLFNLFALAFVGGVGDDFAGLLKVLEVLSLTFLIFVPKTKESFKVIFFYKAFSFLFLIAYYVKSLLLIIGDPISCFYFLIFFVLIAYFLSDLFSYKLRDRNF